MVSAPQRHKDQPLKAIGIRLVAILMLAIMTALVKLANGHGVTLLESMFYRNAIALPVIVLFVMAGPGLASLRTDHLGAHISRSALGLVGMILTFGAYILLPLAEATTIGFTTPIFATILAVVVLREFVGIHRWSAVIIGFIGVLLVTRPGSGSIPLFGALVSLGSALMIAIISILLRQLGRTEIATTTVFYFALLSALVTGGVMLAGTLLGGGRALLAFHGHTPAVWAILIALGVAGAFGQLALTASLRYGAVATVVTIDYTNLIWATVFGWLLFGALPATSTWVGAPLVIGSGLYIAWRERVRRGAV